jgi:hypothetical protein
MKIYLAICLDHHQDACVRAFQTMTPAVAYAKAFVAAQGCPPEDVEEREYEGYPYYCTYGEGDKAYVKEAELNA